ncbi:MAG: hypothetical protein ACLQSR_00295 [Limisphaerales bacterium]
MKTTLSISIGLNLALAGGLIFFVANHRNQPTISAPVVSESTPPPPAAPAPLAPVPPQTEPPPFHWSQLLPANNYRAYLANLRASGCPETTIDDIVRGDTDRAFAYERAQLGLSESGNGPWSEWRENQLIASLLGEPSANQTSAPAQIAENPTPENNGEGAVESASAQSMAATPLFLQYTNWDALGFNAGEQAAIARVRQQYQNQVASQNQSSSGAANQNSDGAAGQNSTPAGPNIGATVAANQSQTALQNANDQLRGLLGGQDYEAYVQQEYYLWFQRQSGSINPRAFSP